MALSDEMKQLLAALAPMVQTTVDTALKAALPAGLGALAATVVDAGVGAVEAHNPALFPAAPAAAVPGVAGMVQGVAPGATATQAAVAKAMGNAPVVAAPAQIAPVVATAGLVTPDGETVTDLPSVIQALINVETLLNGLAAKVEALSAATGMQTSAAMAAHTPAAATST
jgi:hypothetical protein